MTSPKAATNTILIEKAKEITRLQGELHTKQMLIDSKSNEIAMLRGVVGNRNNEIEELNQAINELKLSNEGMSNRINAFKEEIASINASYKLALQDVDRLLEETDPLRQEIATLKQQNQSLRDDLLGMHTESKAHAETLIAQADKLKAAQAKIEDLIQDQAKTAKELSSLESTKKYHADNAQKAQHELEQIHSVLDFFKLIPPREIPSGYGKAAVPITTRLGMLLALHVRVGEVEVVIKKQQED